MMETSGFAKYVIQGEDAELWLDQVLACRIPKHGRMCLAPMLNEKGKLVGDFTLTRMDDEDFLLIGSGVAEEYHLRWFSEYLDPELDVHVIPQSSTMLGLAVAGPKSRELMQKVSPYDFSNDYFRFMEMKQVSVGLVECLVGRVSYTGDLGYEIWMEAENQRSVFQTLMQEGESLGIGLFGLRALNSLRLEKNFGSWAREFRPIYGPMEAGLNPFVAYDKEADFIGKEIARKEKEEGGNLRLRTFVVDAKDADVIGDEPIWHGGEVKGWVTSGGFAHGSGVSMAMGYVPREIADQTSGWEIEILNERCSCKLQPKPLFDPEAKIMRG